MQTARKKVSFIGIGAGMAPSLLYSYIKLHPEICFPKEETNFFNNTEVYARGLKWYENQFIKSKKHLVCGELVENYLQYAPTAGLIAKTLPDARLIVVIENPLLAVRVSYVEARRNNLISKTVSLAHFLKNNPEILQSICHGKQLAKYFSYYSPTDLLVLTADEVRDEPLRVLKEVYDHIGVNNQFIPTELKYLLVDEEAEKKKKPWFVTRLIKKIINSFIFIYKNLKSKVQPLKLPVEIAFTVARQIPLSPEVESYLKKYYKEDVNMLSHLLRRSLANKWGFDE